MHKVIEAGEGMILTNGETYGKRIHLGEGDSKKNWREITLEEYEAIQVEEIIKEGADYEGY